MMHRHNPLRKLTVLRGTRRFVALLRCLCSSPIMVAPTENQLLNFYRALEYDCQSYILCLNRIPYEHSRICTSCHGCESAAQTKSLQLVTKNLTLLLII